MPRVVPLLGFVPILLLVGCASTAELEASKAEADKARAAAIKVAQSFATYKKDATTEAEKLKQELAAAQSAVEVARSERDRTAAEIETLRKETDQLKRESAQEIASLRDERTTVETRLATTKAEAARISEELDNVRQRLQDKEQGSPVVVTTTLVPPPDLQQKLRILEEETVKGTEERLRLERRANELERLLESAQRAEADAVKKAAEPIRLRIVDRLLFESGEAQLRVGGCKLLKPVADRLRQVTDYQFRIEGHTDSKPPRERLRSRYPSNWELSSARATNVVRCLVRDGGLPADRVSAVGYGASRPIDSNETEEGRKRNRRVEIVLFPVIPTEMARDSAP